MQDCFIFLLTEDLAEILLLAACLCFEIGVIWFYIELFADCAQILVLDYLLMLLGVLSLDILLFYVDILTNYLYYEVNKFFWELELKFLNLISLNYKLCFSYFYFNCYIWYNKF